MKIVRYIYTGYGLVVFTIGFIVLLPFFLILIQIKSWHKYVFVLNRVWAKWVFGLLGIPMEVEYRERLSRTQRYVFCPNHFSYLDIPTCGLIAHPFIFVGKNSMARIPLFGYMYGKIHITVDRNSLKSKYNTLVKAKAAIDHGKSIVIFPEGGIKTTKMPKLAAFKEGPFRIAIEKQIPVVPVTIPYNWIILPDNENLFNWRKGKLICHEPISTEGMSLADVDKLKEKVFSVIETELEKYFPSQKTETVEKSEE
ncbi:MAG TPA: lysophospholipid acyltransferase family protein [Cyclobacteriaceae bacterium]